MRTLLFLATALLAQADPVLEKIVAHVQSHPTGDAPFSFNLNTTSTDLANLPIGVFDSGIGGLTVLEEILKIDAFHNDTLAPGPDGHPDFENERFIYFGDQANMPYGNYSAENNLTYLRELILKDALFLLGNRHDTTDPTSPGPQPKPSVKALVIACNTATAYGLEDLRALIKELNLPIFVVGVVEAGARGLLTAPEDGSVAVFATVGTCASGAYPKAIQSTRGLAGRPAATITQHGSPALAGVIEGDPAFTTSLADQITADVKSLVDTHVKTHPNGPPLQKIILGCTHFPLAQKDIDTAFATLRKDPAYTPHIAPALTYVNPAEWTAKELFRSLASARLRHKPGTPFVTERDLFFLSVPNPKFPGIQLTETGALDHTYKYRRQSGHLDHQDTLNIPMTPEKLPPTSRHLIESRLPATWSRLVHP
jgi:glutamate racemase